MTLPPSSVRARSLVLLLTGCLVVGVALAGCGKRRVVKLDEDPPEPTSTPLPFRPVIPQPAMVTAPPVTKPVDPTLAEGQRWRDEQRVRDQFAEAAAAQLQRRKEQERRERREAEAKRAEQKAQEQAEAERREVQKEETRAMVIRRVRKALKEYADNQKLTIVEELPLEVTFNEDLRSGKVSYRMWLNDTGLMGIKSATMVWKGEMTWALVEHGDAVVPATPKPTVIPLDKNGMPKGTPENKPGGKSEKKPDGDQGKAGGKDSSPDSTPDPN